MFKRLRIRLAVVCTVVTGIILAGMACGSLYISEQELARRGQSSFHSDVNSILYHIASQNVLDHTWLAQTEASGGLMLYLEDSGAPLLFEGTERGVFLLEAKKEGQSKPDSFAVKMDDGGERKRLLLQAKEAALSRYGLDISKKPETRLQPETVFFSLTDTRGQEYYAAVSAAPLQSGWVGLTVLKSMRDEQMQVYRLRWTLAGLVALAILLLFVFAWFFTARAMKPVEESRRRQMAFVSAASHELRSPLAVIQTSITALEQAPPPQARRFSQTITGECARMSRLVGDMLTLAGADNGSWSVHWAQAEPETLLLDSAERFEAIAARKNIHIDVKLPEEPLPKCRCDSERIGQVLAILLDNAVSYTPEGGRVSLSAEAAHHGVRIAVADNGLGIPDAEKAHIFERFYRADLSRSKKEHYGLGLCIAKEIADLHRGKLTVRDTPSGGATFVLFLPC